MAAYCTKDSRLSIQYILITVAKATRAISYNKDAVDSNIRQFESNVSDFRCTVQWVSYRIYIKAD